MYKPSGSAAPAGGDTQNAAIATKNSARPIRLAALAFRPALQSWDRRTAKAVDRFVTNSDYIATKIVAQTINDLKSAESPKIIEHFEKGAKFDLLKTRQGYFRGSDHQLMHEMYAVTALPADKIKNQWDIFTSSPAVPGPNEDLEVIAATKEENSCTFPS